MAVPARDAAFGLAFAALGVGMAAAGWRLPEGVAGVPGPGVFPVAIGIGLTLLGAGLAIAARAGQPMAATRDATGHHVPRWDHPRIRQIAAVLTFLAAYVALWDVVPFAWRTPVLLLAVYRVLGEPWLQSAVIAGSATALLALVFNVLLRVRL